MSKILWLHLSVRSRDDKVRQESLYYKLTDAVKSTRIQVLFS